MRIFLSLFGLSLHIALHTVSKTMFSRENCACFGPFLVWPKKKFPTTRLSTPAQGPRQSNNSRI